MLFCSSSSFFLFCFVLFCFGFLLDDRPIDRPTDRVTDRSIGRLGQRAALALRGGWGGLGQERREAQSVCVEIPVNQQNCQRSLSYHQVGDLAQMVERMLSMHEAQGSIPWFSTLFCLFEWTCCLHVLFFFFFFLVDLDRSIDRPTKQPTMHVHQSIGHRRSIDRTRNR